MPNAHCNDISLYYEVHGKGPSLLLIAGLGSDSSSWQGVVGAFSPHFQTVALDNRGSGRSGIAHGGCTVRAMAEDAVRLLDSLSIERTHVVGHSMGGYIAQELAIRHPDRVGRLVLESTAPVSSRRNNVLFEDMYRQLASEGVSESWVGRWAVWLFSPGRRADRAFVAGFIARAANYPYVPKSDGFKCQIDAIASFDARDRLGAIRAATLILEGGDDALIPPGEAELLARSIGGSIYRIVDGVGHCIHLENPTLFADAVLGFLHP